MAATRCSGSDVEPDDRRPRRPAGRADRAGTAPAGLSAGRAGAPAWSTAVGVAGVPEAGALRRAKVTLARRAPRRGACSLPPTGEGFGPARRSDGAQCRLVAAVVSAGGGGGLRPGGLLSRRLRPAASSWPASSWRGVAARGHDPVEDRRGVERARCRAGLRVSGARVVGRVAFSIRSFGPGFAATFVAGVAAVWRSLMPCTSAR